MVGWVTVSVMMHFKSLILTHSNLKLCLMSNTTSNMKCYIYQITFEGESHEEKESR